MSAFLNRAGVFQPRAADRGPHRACWLLFRFAIARTLLRWGSAGREVFDQELLKEEMLEYLALDHFLYLIGSVATT